MKEIIDSGYLTDFSKAYDFFYRPLMIEALVHMNHLLQHLNKKYNDHVDFTDDVPNVKKDNSVSDITDLINYFRNAACHDTSDQRKTPDWNRQTYSVAFALIVGTKPHLTYPVVGKYEDDAILLMGTKHLYVKKHLVRAYEEVVKRYLAKPEFLLYKEYFKNHP